MKIVLTSHGDLCHGMLKTLGMFVSIDDVLAISLDESGVEAYSQQLDAALCKEEEYLFLTDIEGGSPYQTVIRYKFEHNMSIEVVSGLNLPMAIEAVIGKDLYTPIQLRDKCQQTGIDSIKYFELKSTEDSEDE